MDKDLKQNEILDEQIEVFPQERHIPVIKFNVRSSLMYQISNVEPEYLTNPVTLTVLVLNNNVVILRAGGCYEYFEN